MATELQIQAGKVVLMKYSDPKLEYTGMSAYEIAKLILEAAEIAEVEKWAEEEARKGTPGFLKPAEAV